MAHAELTQAAAGEAMSPRRRWLAASLEASLGRLVEIPAALLVVAEIVILFAGVVARYVLHKPLIWSDELASILFLWLAMLGAAVAFRRGEHMRMTALVARASPGLRAFLDLVAKSAQAGTRARHQCRHAHVLAAAERDRRAEHREPQEQDRGQFVRPDQRLVQHIAGND